MRSSRRVPPLMATSPFLLLALSFHFSLFCLVPPRMSLDCINFSPSSLLSNLTSSTTAPTLHHPFLLCSPSPLQSLPLPSINFLLLPHLLFSPIQFLNLVCSQMHTRACALSLIFPCFFPSLSLSSIGSEYPAHPAHILCSHLGDNLTFPALSGV